MTAAVLPGFRAEEWTRRNQYDGWVTWVNTKKVQSENPGYCFLLAGWWRDRDWHHPQMIRLRARAGL